MQNIVMDVSFAHKYEVSLLDEIPNRIHPIKQLYYPDGNEQGGSDGIWIYVEPMGGEPWIGVFAFGYSSKLAFNGIFTHPDNDQLVVISSGEGYIVKTSEPHIYETMRAFPITAARSVPEHNLIVVADFTTMVAYNQQGLIWQTERLSWDGIKIVEINSTFIKIVVWDAPKNKNVDLCIDLKTGVTLEQHDVI